MAKKGGLLTNAGATLIDNELNALRKNRYRSGVGQSDSPYMRDDYRIGVISQDVGRGALVGSTLNLGAGHAKMLYPSGDYQLTVAEDEILVRSTYGLQLFEGRRVYLHREFVSGWWMAMPMYTATYIGVIESTGGFGGGGGVRIWLNNPDTNLSGPTDRLIPFRYEWMTGGELVHEGQQVAVVECPEEGLYRLLFAECEADA